MKRDRTTILISFLSVGGVVGMAYGAILGLPLLALLFLFPGAFPSSYMLYFFLGFSIPVGLVLGVVNGFTVGGITQLFFKTVNREFYYKVLTAFISMLTTFISSLLIIMALIKLYSVGPDIHASLHPTMPGLLALVLSMLSTMASQHLAEWYLIHLDQEAKEALARIVNEQLIVGYEV